MPEYQSLLEADYTKKFKSEIDQYHQDTQHTLKRAKITERWLSVMSSHIIGTIFDRVSSCLYAPTSMYTFESTNFL